VTTDYRECQWCHVRLIFALDAHDKKLPAVEYGEDPLGTVAVTHEITGEWRGRFIARGDPLSPAEALHAVHHCEGMERQRRSHGRTAVQQPRSKRRLPVQGDLLTS
jgi:hypothetical protein